MSPDFGCLAISLHRLRAESVVLKLLVLVNACIAHDLNCV